MWILPTHNRPEQCGQVVRAMIDYNCSSAGIVLINGGNADRYIPHLQDLPAGWAVKILKENIGLGGAMQWLFTNFPGEPFYGLITDDEFVQTNQWDCKLVEAAGAHFISHGRNLCKSADLPHGLMIMGGDLVRTVGWWSPPGVWHWYIDAFWQVIGKRCGINRPCIEVEVEERHYITGKWQKDETNVLGESRSTEDQAAFEAWLRDESPAGMLATCARVNALIKTGDSNG